MKRFFFLCTILVPLAFTACKKDSDDVKNDNTSIVGLWTIASIHEAGYNGTTLVREYNNTNAGKATFNANGTFTVTGPNGEEPERGKYTYSESNKTLTILYDGETQGSTASVLEKTNNRFVFRGEYINNPPVGGVDREVTTITLTR